jgi:hypothetical protein
MPKIISTLLALALLVTAAPCLAQNETEDTYSQEEISEASGDFMQEAASDLAKLIEKAFADYGRPNGYIKGTEAGGAFIAGLRYGEGTLHMKEAGPLQVYWQGPSLGIDFGLNAARVFTLVYNLPDTDTIFQRFPGVDGSVFIAGGLAMNYQKSGNVILAPIRTGLGLRLGANVGYLHYTREKHVNPF